MPKQVLSHSSFPLSVGSTIKYILDHTTLECFTRYSNIPTSDQNNFWSSTDTYLYYLQVLIFYLGILDFYSTWFVSYFFKFSHRYCCPSHAFFLFSKNLISQNKNPAAHQLPWAPAQFLVADSWHDLLLWDHLSLNYCLHIELCILTFILFPSFFL